MSPSELPETCARFRDARRASGVTQVRLAAALGIQQAKISAIETGRWKISERRLAEVLPILEALASSARR